MSEVGHATGLEWGGGGVEWNTGWLETWTGRGRCENAWGVGWRVEGGGRKTAVMPVWLDAEEREAGITTSRCWRDVRGNKRGMQQGRKRDALSPCLPITRKRTWCYYSSRNFFFCLLYKVWCRFYPFWFFWRFRMINVCVIISYKFLEDKL